jgi:hypothetical protein
MISWVKFIAQGPHHPPPEEFEQMPTIIAAGMVPTVGQGGGFTPKNARPRWGEWWSIGPEQWLFLPLLCLLARASHGVPPPLRFRRVLSCL